MQTPENSHVTQDDEHLKLLYMFHYVLGGLAGLFALFPIVHLVLGIYLIVDSDKLGQNGGSPPAFVGWIFVFIAAVIMVLGWTFAGFLVATGRCLAKRKRYMFCFVMAAIECIFVPFGTVLGVFTLVVLMRESVKKSFVVAR